MATQLPLVEKVPAQAAGSNVSTAVQSKAKKLNFNDQRELEELPKKIERLEKHQSDLQQETAAPDFYQQEHSATTEKLQQLAAVTAELEECYERWVALSE